MLAADQIWVDAAKAPTGAGAANRTRSSGVARRSRVEHVMATEESGGPTMAQAVSRITEALASADTGLQRKRWVQAAVAMKTYRLMLKK